MKEAASLVEEFLQPYHFSQSTLQFIANSTGRVAASNEINAKYFANHMMMPVLFEESSESLHVPFGSKFVFVGIGPKPIVTNLATACFVHSVLKKITICVASIDPNNLSDDHIYNTLRPVQNGFQRVYKFFTLEVF